MVNGIAATVGLAFLQTVSAVTQSSLYPSVDPVSLASAFNISIGCLDALNETVSCDATLLQMAGSADDYLWYQDNATALCTTECLSTTKTWWSDVISACANDYINVRGRQVSPLTIPGRILDGLNIACLTPDTDVTTLPGINGTEVTTTVTSETNSTVTVDTTVPTATDDTTLRRRRIDQHLGSPAGLQVASNITQRQSTPSSSGFCLIDSYSWVGVDIIRPDCPDGSTDPQCLDPTDVPDENQRIANLYPDSLLCSDCFLKMFYLRMASPYLPDLDASDYHLEQYLDIVDVCQATMPELLVRILPLYDNVDGVWDGAPEINSTVSSATVNCGQNITMTDLQDLVVPDPTANGTIYCDALSTTYNVTTGDLQVAFGEPFCSPDANFTSVCVPTGCTVMEISYNSTCDSVISGISTAENNITTIQLLAWNPNLQGFCDQLSQQYICISAPGGSYIPPPVSNETSSDAGQQRGGGSGSSTGSGSVAGGGRNATVVAIGGAAPSPTQSGITPLCTEYAMASAGDGCYSLTQLWRIPEADFFAWNTVLGPNGENCSTQLFADYYYCIDIVRTSTTATATATTTSVGVTAPGPTQSGIISTCNKFAESIPGKGCYDFAVAEGITPAQLYAWNPVLGANGENCGTEMWADEYYCVGVSSSTSVTTTATPTTTSVVAPGPTQSGIISTCNKFAESISGLGCYDFAVAEGITTAQLYAWNPVLGANGENCGTEMWADEYYCVGVSS
ncbi:Carbohydrate-binding module family 50 protein [Pleurostoma richardsiae]|uniref:Carbohydrate-binding module family 50 protein n=1 Tax=Pleurostoma richardsiae TaxID=41990 RepID=A0AA38R8Z1_9PEZI|nr:Carbohydrate-binding module family 50 protein [Pleurostoma richardsiae]